MPYSHTSGDCTIGDYTSSRDNNFNLLRFLAASGVILSHSIILSGGLENGSAWALGYISVNCFFIISGFLVTSSLLNRDSIGQYALARVLRIYPGLLACVLICIIAVGLFSHQQGLWHFLSSPQTLEFWLKNSLLIFGEVETDLPTELFANNPVKDQVNAPLWTLQYEVLMYCTLAIIFLVNRLINKRHQEAGFFMLVIVLGGASMTLFLINVIQDQPLRGTAANLVRFSAMFFGGSALYLLRNKIKLNHTVFLTICFLVVLAFSRRELLILAVYLSLGYLLIYLAYIPDGPIRLFNRLGDYSYGMYIYAFPVQQFLVTFYPTIEASTLLVLTMGITLPIAMISWHLIESPALALKR